MAKTYGDPTFQFRIDAVAVGHIRNDVLAGAVVYDTFSDGDCLVHLVSDGSRTWMTREFAIRALAYPFLQRRNRRLSCLISERNAASLRFTRKFGWTEEGRLREAGPAGEDLVLFGLLRRECRFLPENRRLFPARGDRDNWSDPRL